MSKRRWLLVGVSAAVLVAGPSACGGGARKETSVTPDEVERAVGTAGADLRAAFRADNGDRGYVGSFRSGRERSAFSLIIRDDAMVPSRRSPGLLIECGDLSYVLGNVEVSVAGLCASTPAEIAAASAVSDRLFEILSGLMPGLPTP